jgi:hypothetical protein
MTIKTLSNSLLYLCLASLLTVLSSSPTQAASPPEIASDPEVSKFGGETEIQKFAVSLCIDMASANSTGKDIVKVVEDKILSHIKISRATPNYNDKIITFWNENKNDFICKGKVTEKTRESEHLMKRAVALSIHNKVFYNFLLNNPNTDVNAIEWVIGDPAASEYLSEMQKVTHAPWGTGEPETILDYLDKILADPEASIRYVISDIKRLRKMLIDYFNAKTAKELGY